MTKKKKSLLPKEFEPAFSLAGASIGSSILGGAFASKLPAGSVNPLTSMGTATAGFVGPVATIGVMGYTMKQLNKTKKKLKGGKKYG